MTPDPLDRVAAVLDRLGVMSAARFRPAADLAWPRIVTGFAIMSKQTADLAMVGIAVGTAGTAGLAFALAYWQLVVLIGLGLAGGTVSLVSQNHGGGEDARAAVVVAQSVLIAVAIATPIAAAFVLLREPLIGAFDPDPASLRHGAAYLAFVAPAVLFELLNLIASRTYTGVGDTYTEMVARAGGAVLNVVLSGAFIFGAGMGVVGAALGTTLSTGAVTVVLAWGMTGREYGHLGMEPSPVPVGLGDRVVHAELAREVVEISAPQIGRRIGEGLIVFPLLWIAATFGPVVVTAVEVGRRVRSLINGINWGAGMAASSLVGQHLGAGDEAEAAAYGRGILRVALLLYVGLGAAVIVAADPIAGVFVGSSAEAAQVAPFVAVAAVSAVGLGLDGATSGALLGAGDTRLPFLASLVGRYVLALPVAALGLVTSLGVTALYAAFLLETFVPGGINYALFRSGRWKAVSRRYRPSAADD